MTAEATDRYVDLAGLRLHYRDWGGDGPPLVLLHGLASNCRIWDLVAPLLRSRFRVVAPDLRGHGQTEGPDDGYDFDTISGDVHGFLAALGLDSPILAGHSWGGNVVLHYAAGRPADVAGLVMVDGGLIEVSRIPGMTWERAQVMLAPPDFAGVTWDSMLAWAKDSDLGTFWNPTSRPS